MCKEINFIDNIYAQYWLLNLVDMQQIKTLIVSIIIFLYLFCQSIWAQPSPRTYYVSSSATNASDNNPGTKEAPWKTPYHAVWAATTPGDTIAFRRGDIFELDSNLLITQNGTAENPIVWDGGLWGDAGDPAKFLSIMDADDRIAHHDLIRFATCSYLVFQNFIVDDDNYSRRWGIMIGGASNWDGPPEHDNEHHITIQHCEIKNVGDGSTYVGAGIMLRVVNNDIHDIYLQYNNIHDITSHGIAIYALAAHWGGIYGAKARNVYIGYNKISRISHYAEGHTGPGDGIILNRSGVNILVEHNEIITDERGQAGIDVYSSIDQLNGINYVQKMDSVIIRYNTIHIHSEGYNRGIDFSTEHNYPGSIEVHEKVYGNLIQIHYNPNCGTAAGIQFDNPRSINWAGSTFTFFNNTIISFGYQCVTTTHFNDPNIDIIFYNNIMYMEDPNSNIINAGGNLIHSNNLYYKPSEGNIDIGIIDGTRIFRDDVPSWEPGGIFGNPLFANIKSNWHLQAGSPAIGKGAPIEGYTEDIEGAPVGNPPNIGCYETLAGEKDPEYVRGAVEDATPRMVHLFFDLFLDATSIPDVSSFQIDINGHPAVIESVQINSTEVQLELQDSVRFGNVITASYTPPATNGLRSVYGRYVAAFSNKPVENHLLDHSAPPEAPVVVIDYEPNVYSGFIGRINASRSYDKQNLPLTFSWNVPDTIPVSSTSTPVIQFLAPLVTHQTPLDFVLHVSNGDSVSTQTVTIYVNPYFATLSPAHLVVQEASDSVVPYVPQNSIDGNPSTWWAAKGKGQSITYQLDKTYMINHMEISFPPGQRRASRFSIFGAADSTLNWMNILTDLTSCSFSEKTQIFPFPGKEEYRYIRIVGLGNSQDDWNTFAEIRIRGTPHIDSITMQINPNPASDHIRISIQSPPDFPDLAEGELWTLLIYNISEILVYQKILTPGPQDLAIPLKLSSGVYVVQLITGPASMIAQKLIIVKGNNE